MNTMIVNRVLEEANTILETKQTVRELAHLFHVSKSTVHKDLHERLKVINPALHFEVNKILQYHLNIRHLRGGESTKKKYQKSNKNI